MAHMLKRINPFRKIGSLLGVTLMALSLFFYRPVLAESVGGNSPIIGVNIHIYDYEMGKYPIQGSITLETEQTQWRCVSSTTGRCDVYQSINSSSQFQDEITGLITYTANSQYEAFYYEYEFVLDGEYAGYFVLNTGVGATASRTVYVNGGSVKITHPSLITSFTVTSYNLVRITDPIMWTFPVESLPTIKFVFDQGYKPYGLDESSYYMYPVFKTDTSKMIANGIVNAGNSVVFILAHPSTIGNSTQFQNYFSYNGRITKFIKLISARGLRFTYIELLNDTNANINSSFIPIQNDIDFIPVYYGDVGNKYVSTDFALRFGLSNDLLDNVSIIANGTVTSNSAAANNDNIKDEFIESSDDLIAAENSFNDSMNSSLNNIDTNFSFNSKFGNKFLQSANWVRTQFNNMTGSTPFGSVLGYALLLGIGLLIIGKALG